MMMGGGLIFGFFILILFLLLVAGAIGAVVWFVRQGARTSSQGPRKEPPRQGSQALEVLRERYARGEIDREEFQRMRDEIEN